MSMEVASIFNVTENNWLGIAHFFLVEGGKQIKNNNKKRPGIAPTF